MLTVMVGIEAKRHVIVLFRRDGPLYRANGELYFLKRKLHHEIVSVSFCMFLLMRLIL